MDNGCIHAAVNAGDVEALALLLRHGADPSAAGKGGWVRPGIMGPACT